MAKSKTKSNPKSDAPAIDIGIGEKQRAAIAKGLSSLLADTYTLYLTTHNFHWNVTGPSFNTLHTMFMTQYTELWGALDLVAPGTTMPVAVPTFEDASGYSNLDGTSFSAPLVAGAAAWVWTVRPQLDPPQLQDVLRNSARDVGVHGWDPDTGFGILSIPAALSRKASAKDPQEPNDDINLVRPHAVTASGTRLPTPARIQARLDVTEDPEDVYRVWVPAHGRIAAGTRSAANVNLALWGPRTKTVYERSGALKRDLLAYSQRSGSRPELVSAKNGTSHGAYYFVDAFLGKGVGEAAYSLKVSVARR